MNRLSEKVAIVRGASEGIGGIATAMAAEGAHIAVNYSSDRESAERVAQTIIENGGKAITIAADVSKAADVARLFREVNSTFGRLDVLVNNLGVFRFGAFTDTDLSPPLQHQRPWNDSHRAGGDQAVRRRGRKHHQPQFHRGLASGSGSAALRIHERRHRNADQGTLALELAPRRIRVNAIAPGHTETEGNVTAATFEVPGPFWPQRHHWADSVACRRARGVALDLTAFLVYWAPSPVHKQLPSQPQTITF
jgi:3-oxoacyl-[acyl-carrier protein] reductase